MAGLSIERLWLIGPADFKGRIIGGVARQFARVTVADDGGSSVQCLAVFADEPQAQKYMDEVFGGRQEQDLVSISTRTGSHFAILLASLAEIGETLAVINPKDDHDATARRIPLDHLARHCQGSPRGLGN